MAEHTIETRILLRYDTYSRWMNSNTILKQGEAAICAFPTGNAIEVLSDITPDHTPPAIGIKVGDGVHYFRELPWVQAIAADVYNWAKQVNKPSYSASEISGLEEYIQSHSGGSSGGEAPTAYRITYDSVNKKYLLETYDEELDDWVATGSEIDLSSILNRITTIENWANGATNNLGNITTPLLDQISDAIITIVGRLNVTDEPVEHQFVTSVSESRGRITVNRASVSTDDITLGIFPTERGGTGFATIGTNEILIGSNTGKLQKTNISTTINDDEADNNIPNTGAIKKYVEKATAGLTGAMHFIGESTVVITPDSNVNPQISGYNFRYAAAGDVILYDAKEFVWNGMVWKLLGDESSYAIKGSIINRDIADEANIAIDKIANLQSILENKVDVVEGKQLSTNDYTDEEKSKLAHIEERAQANLIEHIFLNSDEIIPKTVNGLPKSINLNILTLTQAQIDKLDTIEENAQVNNIEHIIFNGTELLPTTVNGQLKTINLEVNGLTPEVQEKIDSIETGAQVNIIEKVIYGTEEIRPDSNKTITITPDPHTEHENKIEQIFINNTEYVPNREKQVRITLDEAALNLSVIKGARVPNGGLYEDVDITPEKKLELSRIAKTGNIVDIIQDSSTFVILDCGTSTSVL